MVRPPATWNYETERYERDPIGYTEMEIDGWAMLRDYLKNPTLFTAKNITFKELYNMWSKEHFPRSPQSIGSYKAAYAKCSTLHGVPITEIKKLEMQQVINECDHMSSATRKAIKNFLSLLFKFAIQNDYLEKTIPNI